MGKIHKYVVILLLKLIYENNDVQILMNGNCWFVIRQNIMKYSNAHLLKIQQTDTHTYAIYLSMIIKIADT